jgi:hypothetical protein
MVVVPVGALSQGLRRVPLQGPPVQPTNTESGQGTAVTGTACERSTRGVAADGVLLPQPLSAMPKVTVGLTTITTGAAASVGGSRPPAALSLLPGQRKHSF